MGKKQHHKMVENVVKKTLRRLRTYCRTKGVSFRFYPKIEWTN